jgi:hypothetical protein
LDLPLLASTSVIRTKSQNNRESQALMEVSQVRRLEGGSQMRGPSVVREEGLSSVKYSVNDWNMKFLRNPHEATIVEFEQVAGNAFLAAWGRDDPLRGGLRDHDVEGLLVSVANLHSLEARQLKREFRNYHFVLEACKAKLVVGVPLTCLIEWQGVVALVKAPLPRTCPKVPFSRVAGELRDL